MHRHRRQPGASCADHAPALFATLAIFTVTLVFVISNQQKATAHVRSQKQSFYAAEGALDTGVRLTKVK